MTRIDFFYDFRSPFAYFATQRMDLLLDDGIEIHWRPVSVSVLLNLQANKEPWAEVEDPLCPAKRAHFMADIFRLIEYWKIPFAMPSPPIPVCDEAMAIAALLERDGVSRSGFHDAVFEAVWQEQKDAADPEVLRACLAAGSHDPGLQEAASREGLDLLTAKTRTAYDDGVFGVPTFVVGQDLYFGADRMELLASRL